MEENSYGHDNDTKNPGSPLRRKKQSTAGQIIMADLDLVLGNDITTPVAINEFNKAGCDCVYNQNKVVFVMDHFVPNKDIKAAEQSASKSGTSPATRVS